jgi:hypothetical protein
MPAAKKSARKTSETALAVIAKAKANPKAGAAPAPEPKVPKAVQQARAKLAGNVSPNSVEPMIKHNMLTGHR